MAGPFGFPQVGSACSILSHLILPTALPCKFHCHPQFAGRKTKAQKVPTSGRQQSQDLSPVGRGWTCPGSSQGVCGGLAATPAVVNICCSLQKVRLASLPPCLLLSSHPRCPPGPNRDTGPNGLPACVDHISGTGETSDFLKDSSEHLQGMTNHPRLRGSNQ